MVREADAAGLLAALQERFGEDIAIPPDLDGLDEAVRIASHRVHRRYSDRPVCPDLVRLICALALSAPSKSDLQQRDIIVVTDPALRVRIAGFLPHMPWVREAPAFLVFCANGARLPEIARLRHKPFPNDHLDLFFNATADAAIALATALRAAEAIGLGGCPIVRSATGPTRVARGSACLSESSRLLASVWAGRRVMGRLAHGCPCLCACTRTGTMAGTWGSV